MQVHTRRRKRLLHDRMKDLVFVKFNSRLKQKRDNKDKDPIEKPIHDVVLKMKTTSGSLALSQQKEMKSKRNKLKHHHKELQLHLKEKKELRELTNRN